MFLKIDCFWSINTAILFHETATIVQPEGFSLAQLTVLFTLRVLKNAKEKN